MKITVRAQAGGSVKTDLLALAAFEGEKPSAEASALDRRLGGVLHKSAKAEGFKGVRNTSFTLHPLGRIPARRIALIGAGRRKKFGIPEARELAAQAVRIGRRARAKSLAIQVPASAEPGLEQLARWLVEGALISNYRFRKYKTKGAKADDRVGLKELVLLAPSTKARGPAQRGAKRGQLTGGAVNNARDYANEPASVLYPEEFAARAARMARKVGLACKILDPRGLARLRMNLHLAVGKGSERTPRFVHLTYEPAAKRSKSGRKPRSFVFVGKGITFDSGGLSLKNPKAMVGMHYDMSGAAAVVAAMQAMPALAPQVRVHGLVALAENMPSSGAYRPNDIITGRAGKSVEVISTDAEGRLVLADALAYGADLKPDLMVDVATLTGACLVALGPFTAGVMSNDEGLRERIVAAGARAGEDLWPLPLTSRLKEGLKSEHADLKNTGDAYGGAIIGGLFLSEFVGGSKWAHLDIAGPASVEKENLLFRRGGTGFGTLTLLELATGGG